MLTITFGKSLEKDNYYNSKQTRNNRSTEYKFSDKSFADTFTNSINQKDLTTTASLTKQQAIQKYEIEKQEIKNEIQRLKKIVNPVLKDINEKEIERANLLNQNKKNEARALSKEIKALKNDIKSDKNKLKKAKRNLNNNESMLKKIRAGILILTEDNGFTRIIDIRKLLKPAIPPNEQPSKANLNDQANKALSENEQTIKEENRRNQKIIEAQAKKLEKIAKRKEKKARKLPPKVEAKITKPIITKSGTNPAKTVTLEELKNEYKNLTTLNQIVERNLDKGMKTLKAGDKQQFDPEYAAKVARIERESPNIQNINIRMNYLNELKNNLLENNLNKLLLRLKPESPLREAIIATINADSSKLSDKFYQDTISLAPDTTESLTKEIASLEKSIYKLNNERLPFLKPESSLRELIIIEISDLRSQLSTYSKKYLKLTGKPIETSVSLAKDLISILKSRI